MILFSKTIIYFKLLQYISPHSIIVLVYLGGKEMKNENTSNAYRIAYETIRSQIFNGELSGGTKLVEERLAEKIGVSRTPIREAIRRLEQEGLIKNKTVFKPTMTDLIHTVEVRKLFECYAVEQAAKNMSKGKLKKLKQAISDSQDCSIEENVNANKRFHDIILSECDNPIMIDMAQKTSATITLFIRTLIKHKRPFLHEEHEQIYEAIASKDASLAVDLMSKHLEKDLKFMLTVKSDDF